MPIYEYRCSACGFEKDALQKMSDQPLLDCPQCGKPALVKLISAAGFHLKGSGWYATDFKTSGNNKAAAAKPAGEADATTGTTVPATTDAAATKSTEAPAAKKESAAPSTSGTTTGPGD